MSKHIDLPHRCSLNDDNVFASLRSVSAEAQLESQDKLVAELRGRYEKGKETLRQAEQQHMEALGRAFQKEGRGAWTDIYMHVQLSIHTPTHTTDPLPINPRARRHDGGGAATAGETESGRDGSGSGVDSAAVIGPHSGARIDR